MEIIKNNSIVFNKTCQYLKNIMVGVIYRHPKNCITTFMNNFEVTPQCLQYFNSSFHVAGDINIDSLKSQSNNYVSQYYYFISSYNAYIIVTKATR